MQMRCPKCKNKLVQKSKDDELGYTVRVNSAIEIGADGVAKGKCHFCKTMVSLPLALLPAAPAMFIIPPES